MANQEDVLNEAALVLGIGLRQTEDELVRDMLASSASVVFCTGGVNGDSPTELTTSDIQGVVSTLLTENAYTLTAPIEGANRFGTGPIPNCYVGMAHTELTPDLRACDNFEHYSQYPSLANVIQSSEFGTVDQVRFLISSDGSKTLNGSNNNADVYNVFISGLEAYGIIEQDGATANFIYRPAIYDSALAMNVTLAYKFAEAYALLNDAWIYNLKCTKAV